MEKEEEGRRREGERREKRKREAVEQSTASLLGNMLPYHRSVQPCYGSHVKKNVVRVCLHY